MKSTARSTARSKAVRGGNHAMIPGLLAHLNDMALLPEVVKIVPARFRARGPIFAKTRHQARRRGQIEFKLIHQMPNAVKLCAVAIDSRQDVYVTTHDSGALITKLKQEGILK